MILLILLSVSHYWDIDLVPVILRIGVNLAFRPLSFFLLKFLSSCLRHCICYSGPPRYGSHALSGANGFTRPSGTNLPLPASPSSPVPSLSSISSGSWIENLPQPDQAQQSTVNVEIEIGLREGEVDQNDLWDALDRDDATKGHMSTFYNYKVELRDLLKEEINPLLGKKISIQKYRRIVDELLKGSSDSHSLLNILTNIKDNKNESPYLQKAIYLAQELEKKKIKVCDLDSYEFRGEDA